MSTFVVCLEQQETQRAPQSTVADSQLRMGLKVKQLSAATRQVPVRQVKRRASLSHVHLRDVPEDLALGTEVSVLRLRGQSLCADDGNERLLGVGETARSSSLPLALSGNHAPADALVSVGKALAANIHRAASMPMLAFGKCMAHLHGCNFVSVTTQPTTEQPIALPVVLVQGAGCGYGFQSNQQHQASSLWQLQARELATAQYEGWCQMTNLTVKVSEL